MPTVLVRLDRADLPPRRQIRAVTARAAVLSVVVVAAVLGAAPAGADSTAVGGPLLAGSGLVLPASGPALPPGLVAASWLVADLNTGQVLGARAPTRRTPRRAP